MPRIRFLFAIIGAVCGGAAGMVASAATAPLTMAEVLAAAKPDDWHALDPENTLILEFARGRVVIELAPAFAPNHVANIKALVRERYFDGLVVERVQDDYVVQWGDPDGKRPIKTAKRTLGPEFDHPIAADV